MLSGRISTGMVAVMVVTTPAGEYCSRGHYTAAGERSHSAPTKKRSWRREASRQTPPASAAKGNQNDVARQCGQARINVAATVGWDIGPSPASRNGSHGAGGGGEQRQHDSSPAATEKVSPDLCGTRGGRSAKRDPCPLLVAQVGLFQHHPGHARQGNSHRHPCRGAKRSPIAERPARRSAGPARKPTASAAARSTTWPCTDRHRRGRSQESRRLPAGATSAIGVGGQQSPPERA